MDFYKIQIHTPKDGPPYIFPDWTVGRTEDLMVQGKSFYAVWDEKRQLWSTDEYDVQRLVDSDLYQYNDEQGGVYLVRNLRDWNTGSWASFRKFLQNISDNSHPLNNKLVFANDEPKKSDHSSKRLPYSLEDGDTSAWDELLSVLYRDEERAKIEWAIGSIVSGDSKYLQKFFVFYGQAGSGKSTVLNIIEKLFEGYCTSFDAKALVGMNNAFGTEPFKSNPLVAIQHDGDLSGISDNTKLNSIVSHEEMLMNEKYKPSYTSRVNAMLFVGTNSPVKISDAKSGILRRLIDVHPSGITIPSERYEMLLRQIDFELGAIAKSCLQKYKRMGKSYYNAYRPVEMMLQTDVFYNFIESAFDIFKENNGTTLKQAYALYKEFCTETGIDKVLPQYKFREELRNYFEGFHDRKLVDGERLYSYYEGFKHMESKTTFVDLEDHELKFDQTISLFDRLYPDVPAQLAKESGYPGQKWSRVTTTLCEIDTTKLHFVKVPEHHIIIDFDLVNEDGEKDLGINIHEASKWPATYAELSKSGAGIHLHYFYTGDVRALKSVYDTGIEIKTLLGDASLRRQLSLCNDLDIATITSGLPTKEAPVLDEKHLKSEKSIREMVVRNLRKEIHPGTKSSVDFIHHILEEAYESGITYDVTDMRAQILSFAASSTNQSTQALKTVQTMKFASADAGVDRPVDIPQDDSKPIVFYDVEVYPNLFVVCWKAQGSEEVVRMVNPSQAEIEELLSMKLVGFYNRHYDNHILYAALLGRNNQQLFELSNKIINSKDNKHAFGEAYHLSYTDIYDFSSKKQGLKKFEIELGIHHMEMDIPWDQPVPEDQWDRVVAYCVNDVVATEAVFESRKQDFVARQILAELSGLSVNHTTQQHTARIIFGEEKNPQKNFVYTDLSKGFPGYEFEQVKKGNGYENISTYKGETTGEGGYVYAEEGMYENVALLDVASMHPASIINLHLFGPYTKNFKALVDARLAIKSRDYDRARGHDILDGKLAKFLGDAESDEAGADALAYALKIVINIVYGLTSAKFDNPFRDIRNRDNIVAKRGALFMIDLKLAVQEQGYTVAHVKTDSIKIPNATPEIIDFVFEFGSKYGYDFEHEATYDQFCLVNEAVYIARKGDEWTAVGKQFQHPYVFKKLFTGEDLEFADFCETRSVTQGVMYLDFNEDPLRKVSEYQHVGKTGSFVPVVHGGANLWRIKEIDGEQKKYAVTGTKGYRWIEAETGEARNKEDKLEIDMSYFEKLADTARNDIEFFGPFERFVG